MASEKSYVYDMERDIAVEVFVTPTDAERAASDVVFATDLLNQGLQSLPLPSPSTSKEDENANKIAESEVSLYRWSPPCVSLLLETYRSFEETIYSGKLSHKKVWEEISKNLNSHGYKVTGPQCSSKLRSLKKTYKSIKDHNNKSGNDRRSWQFQEKMDEIFSKKAWCQPVAVASSSGLSSRQSEANSAKETGSVRSPKSKKGALQTLLLKRLKQREEHEEAKKKRHEERMQMDEKFLKVLEKLADK